MTKQNSIVFILLFILPLRIWASGLSGFVYEPGENGVKTPLPNVHIFWAGTSVGTFTNDEGRFHLDRVKGKDILIISYVGFEKDSVKVNPDEKELSIGLTRNMVLRKLVITARESATYISKFDPIITQNITGAELHKAACCNLGESFETNASVDVSYGDAISGAKKIEMLGLTGIYSQLMIENIPDYQGFGRSFGLSYIPGHWLESISVSKGASSVVSGNESITGQISADYKKPDGKEVFYLNLYGNSHGHMEGNSNVSWKINDRLSTMVLGYGGYNNLRIDHNNDGFMDDPLTKRYHFMNRWKYTSSDHQRIILQAGINYLQEERLGGEMDYSAINGELKYGFLVDTRRAGGFFKGCYIFPGRAMTSISSMNNYALHRQESVFGFNVHSVVQKSLNSRVSFDTYLFNSNHLIQTGLSYQLQDYDEKMNDTLMGKKEQVYGAFGQYTFSHMKVFTLLAGFRADYNSLYGIQLTPRLHLRYQPAENTTIRISGGRGYRSVHMYAENLFLLASSRSIVFENEVIPEVAWNYGMHLTQDLQVAGRKAVLNAEFFRTHFSDQMVIDLDRDFEHIYVYQLDGHSFANNFQVDFTFEPIRRLDILLAIRISDARATMDGELVRLPFSKRYKGLANFSYKTPSTRWQFDYTAQFNGPSRLPENHNLPDQYHTEKESPAYVIMNAQITKYFRHWNVYVGGENLTNFVQHHPIIAADDPFGKYFDASQVWGPVIGRKIYVGMRYYIKKY